MYKALYELVHACTRLYKLVVTPLLLLVRALVQASTSLWEYTEAYTSSNVGTCTRIRAKTRCRPERASTVQACTSLYTTPDVTYVSCPSCSYKLGDNSFQGTCSSFCAILLATIHLTNQRRQLKNLRRTKSLTERRAAFHESVASYTMVDSKELGRSTTAALREAPLRIPDSCVV